MKISPATRVREYTAQQHNTQAFSEAMKVRVDYDKIVKYETQELNLKKVGGQSGAIEVAKFDCLFANDFDVLVDPIFKVTKTFGKNVVVSLQCHPGYYEASPMPVVTNEKCEKPTVKMGIPKKETSCKDNDKKQNCKKNDKCSSVEVKGNSVRMKYVTIQCDNPDMLFPKDFMHKGAGAQKQGCCKGNSQFEGHGDCHKSEGACQEEKSEPKPAAKNDKKGNK